jgi:hypothetical protein
VLLFFFSFCTTVSFNVISTLLIDFYPKAPATAAAASNLTRCLLGAGATAAITPMINAMGRGWCFTFLSLFLVVSSPMLWMIYFKGMQWREERRTRTETNEREREKERAARVEEGRGVAGEKPSAPPAEVAEAEAQAAVELAREKGEEEPRIRHELHRAWSREPAL